ncbi:MAG: [Fe-Fe] hydrogenase large subunit C-terminal domain-containing protein [Desulfotomaculaceae bacterium]|nr:[Fe-Fe] hydrogenase large subunit C-terminal domain-containing protein [Desulfotomaculaceae bacterium]
MNTAKVLRTLSAKCRNCYRCVRVCPVKAIGVSDDQAYVNADRCILCGTCVRECPQHAKVYRNDIDLASDLLQGEKVIASVAPSFSAVYDGWKARNLPSALRKLGFFKVTETAEGAALVARQTEKMYREATAPTAAICTACPVVVSYVEKYRPEHLDKLFPVVSPMIAHARFLKAYYGPDAKVIFIGPCIAKKREAERAEYAGDVNAVLTFSELDQWLARENISLETCAESGFDSIGKVGHAKLFALPGGMLKTMGIAQDGTQLEVMNTSGMENLKILFESPDILKDLEIIEPLVCNEGCINGPGIDSGDNLFHRRANLISYAARRPVLLSERESRDVDVTLSADFHTGENVNEDFNEDRIIKVLSRMDKSDPANELNCGSCGYSSCREKAKAVLRGMAEIEMCVPYMRKMAEQRMDKIIASSPSGIVILDHALNILAMNDSFCKFFLCGNNLLGRNISYLLDAHNFEKVATGTQEFAEEIIFCYGENFHQIVYRLPDENQYVGFFTNVSGTLITEEKIDTLKNETISKAQELLDHQTKTAQLMAKFLGESTARSEELVERLISSYEES